MGEEVPSGELECFNIDSAIDVLRNGNDLQRIALVRSMFGLLLNKEDRLLDMLSILQELLSSATSVEFQFEIGEAYKFLLEKVNDLNAEVNLQIIRNILSNINCSESVTRAAWMDLLLEAIDYLPKNLLLNEILPEALKKARADESMLAKIAGCRLLGRQATRLDEADVKSFILPVVQALCKDADAAVRACACKQIPIIAKSLKLNECLSVLMPTIIDLSSDESDLVQEANLEAVVFFLNNVDNEKCMTTLKPLASRFVEEATAGQNPKKMLAVARLFEPLCSGMIKSSHSDCQKWMLPLFEKLASAGVEDTESSTESSDENTLTKSFEPVMTFIDCRQYAASVLPILTKLIDMENFKKTLLPLYKRLCQDLDGEVQRLAAFTFHEVASRLADDAPQMIDSFIDLVYSGDADVIAGLTGHLGQTLKHLYKDFKQPKDNNEILVLNTSRSQLTRILLACNRLIRNASNWRCHEQYLNALICLNNCLPEEAICSSFVPMIKEEILNVRALPCRQAAVKAYISWLVCFKDVVNIRSGVEFFAKTVATHRSCHKRCLLIEACQCLLDLNVEKFLGEHLLSKALSLAEDKVFNVRYKLVKLIGRLDNNYHSAIDHGAIAKAKMSLSDLLSREKRVPPKRSGLIRTGMTPNDDKQDQKENHVRKKSLTAEILAEKVKKENGRTSLDSPLPTTGVSRTRLNSTISPSASSSTSTSTATTATTTETKLALTSPRNKLSKVAADGAKLPPISSSYNTFPRRSIGNKSVPEAKHLILKRTPVQQRQLLQRSPSPRPLFRISSVTHNDVNSASRPAISRTMSENTKSSPKLSNGSLTPANKPATTAPLSSTSANRIKRDEKAVTNSTAAKSYSCMKSSSMSSITRTPPPKKEVPSVIRTGIVSRSVQKFEMSAAALRNSTQKSMTSSLDRSAVRSGSIGYSKSINMSFGTLPSRRKYSTGESGRSLTFENATSKLDSGRQKSTSASTTSIGSTCQLRKSKSNSSLPLLTSHAERNTSRR